VDNIVNERQDGNAIDSARTRIADRIGSFHILKIPNKQYLIDMIQESHWRKTQPRYG
jgi:hypothetical protein